MAQKSAMEDPDSSGTTVSAENKKQPTIQEKKVALREILDGTKPAEIPVQSQDKVSMSDSSANNIAGSKRPNPSSPASPLTYTYARRKLDNEQGKAYGSPVLKEEAFKEKIMQDSQDSQVVQNLQWSQELQNLHKSQHFQNIYNGEVTKTAKPLNGSEQDVNTAMKLQNGSSEEVRRVPKPQNEVREVTNEQNGYKGETREDTKLQYGNMGEASEVTKLVSSSLTASQDWKERFIQLQAFLKNCDQSSQEDYKKMLRSLTAAGRSKHAIELEKRAIHLLLEEGKELYRMKILDVLGKGTASDPSLYLPYQS